MRSDGVSNRISVRTAVMDRLRGVLKIQLDRVLVWECVEHLACAGNVLRCRSVSQWGMFIMVNAHRRVCRRLLTSLLPFDDRETGLVIFATRYESSDANRLS